MFQSQFAVPITHGGYANASDVEVCSIKISVILIANEKNYIHQ